MRHRPRKRFGQNFLVDETVLERIAAVIRPSADDRLLEIGPGEGALTAYLAGTVARYLAVEIDRDLVPFLKARFPEVTVVSGDILRVELEELLGDQCWRVVGNLPYNISSPLLLRLLDHLGQIRDMHFMLQREVAARLAATPGTKAWGRLGVLMQYHCRVEILFEVAPESFSPPPRVWSAVVRLTPRAERLPLGSEDALRTVLRHAFSQRRKRLGNALQSLDLDWARTGVDPGLRADAIDVAQFVALANALR